jgi:hypothetical protein
MFDKMENEDDCLNKVVFSDQDSFHMSGKSNRHNVRIWGKAIPHGVVEHVRDSSKLTSHLPVSLAFYSACSHTFFTPALHHICPCSACSHIFFTSSPSAQLFTFPFSASLLSVFSRRPDAQ